MRRLIQKRQDEHEGDDIFEKDEDGFVRPKPKTRSVPVVEENDDETAEQATSSKPSSRNATPRVSTRQQKVQFTPVGDETPGLLKRFDANEHDGYIQAMKSMVDKRPRTRKSKTVAVSSKQSTAGNAKVNRTADKLMKGVTKGEKVFATNSDSEDDEPEVNGDHQPEALQFYAANDEEDD